MKKGTEIHTGRMFSGARIFSCGKITRARAAALASLPQTYTSQNFSGGTAGKTGEAGFTLIETLVAVSFLIFAIVAPMTLVSKSLSSALYARDQVTAYNLAQEGIEVVRAVRDGHILQNALSGTSVDLLQDIPKDQEFIVDARNNSIMTTCVTNPLKTNGSLYGYGSDHCAQSESDEWTPTKFVRILTACYVQLGATWNCSAAPATDELRVTAKVSWRTGAGQTRSVDISENMYRWIEDGAAAQSN